MTQLQSDESGCWAWKSALFICDLDVWLMQVCLCMYLRVCMYSYTDACLHITIFTAVSGSKLHNFEWIS